MRRTIALVLMAGGLGLAVWLVTLAVGSIRSSDKPKAAPTPGAPRPLRIVFPEGFTRRDMAKRNACKIGITAGRPGTTGPLRKFCA